MTQWLTPWFLRSVNNCNAEDTMRENFIILVTVVSSCVDCFYSSVDNALLDFPSKSLKEEKKSWQNLQISSKLCHSIAFRHFFNHLYSVWPTPVWMYPFGYSNFMKSGWVFPPPIHGVHRECCYLFSLMSYACGFNLLTHP